MFRYRIVSRARRLVLADQARYDDAFSAVLAAPGGAAWAADLAREEKSLLLLCPPSAPRQMVCQTSKLEDAVNQTSANDQLVASLDQLYMQVNRPFSPVRAK